MSCDHKDRYVICGKCREIFPLSKAELEYTAGRDEGMKEATIGIIARIAFYLDENGHNLDSNLSKGMLNLVRSIGFEQGYFKSDFGEDNRTQDIRP